MAKMDTKIKVFEKQKSIRGPANKKPITERNVPRYASPTIAKKKKEEKTEKEFNLDDQLRSYAPIPAKKTAEIKVFN